MILPPKVKYSVIVYKTDSIKDYFPSYNINPKVIRAYFRNSFQSLTIFECEEILVFSFLVLEVATKLHLDPKAKTVLFLQNPAVL